VDDLIALVAGVDGILQGQAAADARAYRWQYIVSGALEPRFQKALGGLTNDAQMARIQAALGPLVAFVGDCGEPALH
jgi:hypothetical protein